MLSLQYYMHFREHVFMQMNQVAAAFSRALCLPVLFYTLWLRIYSAHLTLYISWYLSALYIIIMVFKLRVYRYIGE